MKFIGNNQKCCATRKLKKEKFVIPFMSYSRVIWRQYREANGIIDEKICVILAFYNHSISWTASTVAIWLATIKRRTKKYVEKKMRHVCVAIIDWCDKKKVY